MTLISLYKVFFIDVILLSVRIVLYSIDIPESVNVFGN